MLARHLAVTRGRKLRVDTTAVETTIHYPTDSGLLGDGVRVLARALRRAKAVLGEAAGGGRGRSVAGSAPSAPVRSLHRIARRKGERPRER